MAYLTASPSILSTASKFPCMSNRSNFFSHNGGKFSLRWSQLRFGRVLHGRLFVNCRRTGSDGESSGEEPPETLFMKELKRRGMTPASLLEDNDRSPYGLGNKETKTREEGSEFFKTRNDRGTSTGVDDWGQFNQRARSMALNSEGLEGLIPRAKVLLTLGGTFFFIFWPLILTTLVAFSAVYISDQGQVVVRSRPVSNQVIARSHPALTLEKLQHKLPKKTFGMDLTLCSIDTEHFAACFQNYPVLVQHWC